MKTMLAAIVQIATLLAAPAHASHPLPVVEGKISYTDVVAVEGATKDDLYVRGKLWLANTLNSPDSITLDDKETGVLVAQGTVQDRDNEVGVRTMIPKQTTEKTWRFTLKLQLKDGRYKIEIYDIEYTFAMPGNTVGHRPVPRNLDVLFQDKKMYRRDGSLKDGAPTNIAIWTNERFGSMLAGLKQAMSEKAVLDDF